jgi:hypothetical protein
VNDVRTLDHQLRRRNRASQDVAVMLAGIRLPKMAAGFSGLSESAITAGATLMRFFRAAADTDAVLELEVEAMWNAAPR